MSYISAEDILPKELIETIQQYVSGKSIYIPCKEKRFGEVRQKQGSFMQNETKRYVRSIKTGFRLKNSQKSIRYP